MDHHIHIHTAQCGTQRHTNSLIQTNFIYVYGLTTRKNSIHGHEKTKNKLCLQMHLSFRTLYGVELGAS